MANHDHLWDIDYCRDVLDIWAHERSDLESQLRAVPHATLEHGVLAESIAISRGVTAAVSTYLAELGHGPAGDVVALWARYAVDMSAALSESYAHRPRSAPVTLSGSVTSMIDACVIGRRMDILRTWQMIEVDDSRQRTVDSGVPYVRWWMAQSQHSEAAQAAAESDLLLRAKRRDPSVDREHACSPKLLAGILTSLRKREERPFNTHVSKLLRWHETHVAPHVSSMGSGPSLPHPLMLLSLPATAASIVATDCGISVKCIGGYIPRVLIAGHAVQ